MKSGLTNRTTSPQSAEFQLATRLREVREDKGLTLSQVDEGSGLSTSFLSRVENYRASLTMAGLERVSASLGIPIGVFFEEDERRLPITICRAGVGTASRVRGPDGCLYRMLSHWKRGKLMQPLVVDVHLAANPKLPISHPREEFNYVLIVGCTLTYASDEIKLNEGDSVYYDATVPHTAKVANNQRCRILAVVASRDYLFHRDLSRLLNGDRA